MKRPAGLDGPAKVRACERMSALYGWHSTVFINILIEYDQVATEREKGQPGLNRTKARDSDLNSVSHALGITDKLY